MIFLGVAVDTSEMALAKLIYAKTDTLVKDIRQVPSYSLKG